MNPISIYVKIDSNGKLAERHVTRDVLPRPWVKLSKQVADETMSRPEAFKYGQDGSAIKLKKCRMSVSTTSFYADGKEDFSIGIRGDEVPDGAEVEVTVNGEKHMIQKNDHIEITSNTPGSFTVQMTDPDYWCETNEVTVFALSPSG